MYKRTILSVVVILGIYAGHARALTIGANESVTDGVLNAVSENIIARSGTDGSTNNPYYFDWGDTDGDGSPGPYATVNLQLGNYKIHTEAASPTKSFVLNLNGGSVTGSTASSSVAFSTSPSSDGAAGWIIITNVSHLQIGQIRATPRLAGKTGAGGRVYIGSAEQRAGNIWVGSIDTRGDNNASGDVYIYGSGYVRITNDSGPATIITSTYRGGYAAGNITISHDGELVAGKLDTGSQKYDNSIGGTGKVTIDGDYDNNGNTNSAWIGSIITGTNTAGRGGDVSIRGYAGLTITGVVDTMSGSYECGNVTIRDIGSGGVRIGKIRTSEYHTSSSYGRDAGDIIITNVTGSVILGDVEAFNRINNGASYYGGDLIVTNSGDITITGVINLNHQYSDSRDGVLTLYTSGGVITLSSLNLTNVRYAALSAVGNTIITNALLNFSTNSTGGSGTAVDPYITSQTRLRTPAGKYVEYEPGITENAYLEGKWYRIADLNGTAGNGGILRPRQPKGTVIYFR